MPLPLTDPDTLFEELLQDLPPETAHMAREFKAFVRAKRSKRPRNSCGWSSYTYCISRRTLRGGTHLRVR
jgi:hypothetical protein